MKHRLIDLLVCPACSDVLSLEVLTSCEHCCRTDFGRVKCAKFCSFNRVYVGSVKMEPAECNKCYQVEIDEGILGCRCGKRYPIIGGIPRMLPEGLLSRALLRYHGDFLRKYGNRLHMDLHNGREHRSRKKEETLSSFSFQWTRFSEMYAEWEKNFRDYLGPLVEPSWLRGKLVLDAGCGFGRHVYHAARSGAELIGFDLSEAVQEAHKNTREFAEVHIVQGDIYALPFRAEFDFIYSIGVLHHLPDPPSGLVALAQHLKRGGQVFIWVYGKRTGVQRAYVVVDLLRKLTTKMPYRALYLLTFSLACLSHLVLVYPYRFLNLIGLKGLASRVPFTAYAKFPFRVSHADWFDRLSVPLVVYLDGGDVESWFETANLTDVRISQKGGVSWRAIGRRA